MSTFWLVADKLAVFILIAALVAPFAGVAFGLWSDMRSQGASLWRYVGHRTERGCVLGGLATVTLLYVGVCGPPPGEGVTAQEGKRRGATIVASLEQFHDRTGAFPDSLQQLASEGFLRRLVHGTTI